MIFVRILYMTGWHHSYIQPAVFMCLTNQLSCLFLPLMLLHCSSLWACYSLYLLETEQYGPLSEVTCNDSKHSTCVFWLTV